MQVKGKPIRPPAGPPASAAGSGQYWQSLFLEACSGSYLVCNELTNKKSPLMKALLESAIRKTAAHNFPFPFQGELNLTDLDLSIP